MVDNDPMDPAAETAKLLSITEASLATWRSKGKGPKYLKIGRAVFYRRSATMEWIQAQEHDPASKKRA